MGGVKSSGNTREFETGAHRDCAKGKGRCDLLPLIQASEVLGKTSENGSRDVVTYNLGLFQKDPKREYILAAIEEGINTLPGLNGCMYTAMLEVSHLYEDGAEKYGENNWQKGMPVSVYIDSGIRHYIKAMRGDSDEPHHRGFIWNMLGALWTIDNIPQNSSD